MLMHCLLLLKFLWEFCVWSSCGIVLRVLSSLTAILLRNRELVALLQVCCCCCLMPMSFGRGALFWFVIVAFPGHIH